MASAKEVCSEGLSAEDGFRSRMEAQCWEIKQYRAKVLQTEGRLLSLNEAAFEWIDRYAITFDRNHLILEQ